ncbi:MAG: hypothetical protein Q9169_006956 [Polycauliona sp. 2 TL-2023]
MVASEYLFSELTYRIHTTPSEWAQRATFAHGPLVKILYLTAVEFSGIFAEIEDHAETSVKGGPNPVADDGHLQHAFDTYERLGDEHLHVLQGDECLAQLSFLLRDMTTLRKIVLTGDKDAVLKNQPYKERYRGCHLRRCLRQFDSFFDCSKHHAALGLPPTSGLLVLGKTHVKILLAALAAAGNNTSALELEVKGLEYDGLSYEAFCQPKTPENLAVFSRLTKLHLVFRGDVPWVPEECHGEPDCASATIAFAVNLKHLTLNFQDPEYYSGSDDDTSYFLHNCKLPKLETCTLVHYTAAYRTLARFIKGCPKLTKLTIWDSKSSDAEKRFLRKQLRMRIPRVNIKINGE